MHLLGQHTGAIVAAEAAIQRRERVGGLIYQGIPLYSDEERAEKIASYAPGYTVAEDGAHFKVIWDRVRWLYPTISGESASRQVGEYLAVGPDYAVAYRAVFDYKLDLRALDGIPTLLLHGDQDVLNRMNDVVTAAFPEARLALIPGGTDFVPEEQPEAFAAEAAAHVLAHAGERKPAFKPLYTASVEVQGGRGGSARSLTGTFQTSLVRPAERKPEDVGTDPEELFATGYAACFDSALGVVARREKVELGPVTVTASVTLGIRAGGRYGIEAALTVSAPQCEQAELERIVALADQTCPYSNAVRGNIGVVIQVKGAGA